MLPDPARYEERYRPTGAALGLASALLALGLGFLWHTQLIFAALTVLLAIPAVLAIARRPVAFRADYAGISPAPGGRPPLPYGNEQVPWCPVPGVAAGATRRYKSWRLDREQLAAVTAAAAPGIPVIDAGNVPNRRIEGAGQRQDRSPHGV